MDVAVHELENSTGAQQHKVAPRDKDPMTDRVTTRVLVLDEAMARFLAGVAGGRITPAPVLHKVR